MKNQRSIREEVLHVLSKQKAPIKTGQVVAQAVLPSIDPVARSNRVSTELWKLRKAGRVQKKDGGYILTPVNKSPKQIVFRELEPDVKPEPKSIYFVELEKVKKQVEEASALNDQLKEKNYICNVIIKYLEQRINTLTQRGNT